MTKLTLTLTLTDSYDDKKLLYFVQRGQSGLKYGRVVNFRVKNFEAGRLGAGRLGAGTGNVGSYHSSF